MQKGILDCAEEMLATADLTELASCAGLIETWVAAHARIVPGLGDLRRTRANVTPFRSPGSRL